MQVLTVDVGTGTQDIYLFQSDRSLENGFKLVLPSPTMLIRRKIQDATQRGEALLLTGVTMGGGPCHWAAEAHLQAGYTLFATPEAARTFNDDLLWVGEEMGVKVVSEDEAAKLKGVREIELLDFAYHSIAETFISFGVDLDPHAIAVAVFDHGVSPPNISNRQSRFDYLKDRITTHNRLSAFAYLADDVPSIMTRMKAVLNSATAIDCPIVVMDTAPAAVIGASLDPNISDPQHVVILNIGNFHTLAFRLGQAGIEGVFEHHTGEIDLPRLETLLHALIDGSLTHQQVFNDRGHGALMFQPHPLPFAEAEYDVVVTGPRRSMMKGSHLRTYFAVPFGDMMIAGCFGLLVAVADLIPTLAEPIHTALAGEGSDITPWDSEK